MATSAGKGPHNDWFGQELFIIHLNMKSHCKKLLTLVKQKNITNASLNKNTFHIITDVPETIVSAFGMHDSYKPVRN